MKKTKEIWKPIKGFETCYEVSNKGRIRNIPRHVRFCHTTRFVGPTIKKPWFSNSNVLCITLADGYRKTKNLSVRNLVAEHFLEKPEGKVYAYNINGDKADNRVENIAWGSMSEILKGPNVKNLGRPKKCT